MADLKRKLKFYLQNNMNVLLEGRHGVGKTTVVQELFEEEGINWMYFSASTMDPWVDFIGVPKEREDEQGAYLDLVLPKRVRDDEVQAMFFDEFNRCLSGDTEILLASGESVQIKDLVGKDHFYVYSYDIEKKKVSIGKAHSARLTEKKAKILAVTLDSGRVIKCTENHPFLLSCGVYTNASRLGIGDSLMPLYRMYFSPDDPPRDGYERVWFPEYNWWEYTYVLADEYNIENKVYSYDGGEYRHHLDFNKYNNSPENIRRVSHREHLLLHKKTSSAAGKKAHLLHPDLYVRTIGTEASKARAVGHSVKIRQTSDSYKKKRSEISKSMYGPAMRAYRSEVAKQQWKNGQFDKFDRKKALRKTHILSTSRKLVDFLGDRRLTKELYLDAVDFHRGNGKGKYILSIKTLLKYFDEFQDFVDFFETWRVVGDCGSHHVVKVEHVGFEDVYDISVDKYHNFALSAGVFVHNSKKKVRNAVLEFIQFRRINGREFKNLKVIWAAINPDDDDEQDYDVEKLDPAQKDRFHAHIVVPYKLDKDYFTKKYGNIKAKAAIEWWSALPAEAKNLTSPRRVDYALEIYCLNGDMRDALHSSTNVSKLVSALASGPVKDKLDTLYENGTAGDIEKFFSEPNQYSSSLDLVVKSDDFVAKFVPYWPEEKISSIISTKTKVFNYVMSNYSSVPRFRTVIENVIYANSNKTLVNKIKKALNQKGQVGIDTFIQTVAKYRMPRLYHKRYCFEYIQKYLKKAVSNPEITSDQRQDALNICCVKLIEIASSSHSDSIGTYYSGIFEMINYCISTMRKQGYPINGRYKFDVKNLKEKHSCIRDRINIVV